MASKPIAVKGELPELSEKQADALRHYVVALVSRRAKLQPVAALDVAVNIVAQFPLRCRRG